MSDGPVQYRILALVGEGGFGRVYRARLEAGEGFAKDVAIKLLNDPEPPRSLLERFRDEARILGLIRDRAIVGVEPPVQIGDRWAVVMDFVDGASCGTVLEDGCLPPGVSIEIVGEVARALHSAYYQEGPEGEALMLLHRDIKPENIQITQNGDVRVLDFGIARANFAAREYKTRHALGGTPGYIAPERLQRVEVAAGDVYSLGVVLHELVSGERPSFPPTIDLETLDQAAPPPPGAPQGVRVDAEDLHLHESLQGDPHVLAVLRLAAWMRAQDPDQRPTARQVEEACRDLRQSLPGPYFRDWAEVSVPGRVEMPADDMVGRTLHRHSVMGKAGPTAVPRGTQEGSTQRLAIGAMLGGGVVLGMSGLVVLLLAGAVGLAVALQEPAVSGPGEPGAEAIEFDAAQANAEPVAPASPGAPSRYGTPGQRAPGDAPPEISEPTRAIPSPPPEDEPRRVMMVVPTAQPSAPAEDEEPYEPNFPVRTKPTGTVLVTTAPMGGSLWEGGARLDAVSPRKYELPIGMHQLELRSADGTERHRVPVNVKKGETITICYDFDQNRACGGSQ